MATSAPSWASRMAMPRPIPLLLPVTRALRPSSRSLVGVGGAVTVLVSIDRILSLREMAAAVHANGFAGNEVRLAEKPARFRDFPFAAPTADRSRLGDFRDFLIAHVGWWNDWARRNGVHQDVVGGDFERE